MICKLEIYNGELNLFPVVTNERVFAQITMGNIVKGQPGKSPIIGENDNWWVYNNETGEYEDTGKVATTSDEVVKYVEAKDEEHPNRKAIQLANNDPLTGVAKKEGLGSVNIAMVNEYDVVDLGTAELPLNMNTPKGVRPTVQEAGQTGEEANKIAYLSDLENVGGVEVIKIIGLDPSWKFNYYIDVEENNKVINCMENGIPFIFQMWVGFGGNPYAYISKYFFPIEWNVMNDKYIIYYNDLGLYETGDERKSSIKLNLNLTFEKNKTERYQIGSSTNALIDLRYGNQGVEGYKFLADDGTYKEIPASGSDVEVIKLSELFNSSPSVLIEQTWIFPEENTKLFKALEDGKTIILALYSGSNQSSPYESLRTVCGNPLINHISDTKIEITVEILSVWGGKMNVGNLKLGPFIKGSNYHYVVNFNSGSESTTITLNKSGDGTKFLSDNGNYVSVLPTGGTEGQILKIVDGNPKWVDPS